MEFLSFCMVGATRRESELLAKIPEALSSLLMAVDLKQNGAASLTEALMECSVLSSTDWVV